MKRFRNKNFLDSIIKVLSNQDREHFPETKTYLNKLMIFLAKWGVDEEEMQILKGLFWLCFEESFGIGYKVLNVAVI